MDRIIYTAANGASRITEQQAVISNNLANVSTPGFREQLSLYRSVPVNDGISLPTRVSTVATTPGSNFKLGVVETTGRDLDVAISGDDGWLAIQAPGGGEGYTRAGDLQVGINGLLQTSLGQPVLSDQNTPIEIPDMASLSISTDGTVTAIGAGDPPNNIINLGRLKLANIPAGQLTRGDDGVFRRLGGNGQPLPPMQADPAVRVTPGALEASNASVSSAMVGMIQASRRFEMQMQVISEANTNAERANGILSVGS
jgi:flagellar basal-body rod protein FlgF